MRNRHRAFAWMITIVLAGGCDTAEPSADSAVSFTVRDSAGVEIVENGSVGAWGDSLLTLREDLRIGAIDEPAWEVFGSLRRIRVDPSDTIYVADVQAGEIRVFSPTGEFVRSFGRSGEGPGEFGRINQLLLYGDTVGVADSDLYRWTTFKSDGTLIESVPYLGGTTQVRPHARTSTGWIASSLDFGRPFPTEPQIIQDTFPLFSIGSLEDVIRGLEQDRPLPELSTVVAHYANPSLVYMFRNGGISGYPALWQSFEYYGFDGDGKIYVVRNTGYRIDVIDTDGTHERVITRSHTSVPITSEMTDRYIEHVDAHYDTVQLDAAVKASSAKAFTDLVDLSPLGSLPALGELLVSRDGAILVERPDLVDEPVFLTWQRSPAQSSSWDLFDPDGRFLGTMRFAPDFIPHDFTTEWVIGRYRDELDVQYIVRYRIERPD